MSNAIDCSENPLDLRPAVDRLESMIRQHVAENPGQPLIVMMGENHTMPTHVAMQQLLMQRLSDPNNHPLRIANGSEWPHNMVSDILEKPRFGRFFPASVQADIAGAGSEEKQFLRAYQTVLKQHRAPLTHRNVMAWLDNQNISARPVDASWRPSYALDETDSLTHAIIQSEAPQHHGPIHPMRSKALYMRLRNLAIRECVQSHIEAIQPDVYILPYGSSHLLGSKGKKGVSIHHPFKDSLSNLFAEKGVKTMPVILTYPPDGKYAGHYVDALPPGASEVLNQDGLVIKGLDSKRFAFNPQKATEQEMKTLKKQERKYLEKLSHGSGNVLQLFPDNDTVASYGFGPNHLRKRSYQLLRYEHAAATIEGASDKVDLKVHPKKKFQSVLKPTPM